MLEGMMIEELETLREFVVCRVISEHLFEAVSLEGEVKSFRNKEENEKWVFSNE